MKRETPAMIPSRPTTRSAGRLEVWIPCPLCGAAGGREAYRREVETHSDLGRVEMRLEQCDGCGLLFTNPRPTRAELRRHYESRVASGNTYHATGAGSRAERFLATRGSLVTRAASGLDRPGRWLDVGCATGDLLAHVELPGWQRRGLEPSSQAARTAGKRGLEVTCATLEESPLAERAFELVTCISCLEHAWDPREFLAALDRHVAPGGALVLSVPDSSAPEAQVAEFFGFEHLTHFTRATLSRLLREHGYRPEIVETSEGPALNVIARRVGHATAMAEPVEDDREATAVALRRYQEARAQLERDLRARLEARLAAWKRDGTRVAIHGAGVHTRFLLDLVDLGSSVAALLDSDPAKHGTAFLGWTVHAPEELPRLGVGAVIVSSRPFQEEIVARLAPIAGPAGIEIVSLYPRPEPVLR